MYRFRHAHIPLRNTDRGKQRLWSLDWGRFQFIQVFAVSGFTVYSQTLDIM